MSKFLAALLLLSFSAVAQAEATPESKSFKVERIMRHGCLVGGLAPLNERALERKLNELSSRGASNIQIMLPPTNLTLGGAIVASFTGGIWCPAGYTELVYNN